jgi:hypothetical protein
VAWDVTRQSFNSTSGQWNKESCSFWVVSWLKNKGHERTIGYYCYYSVIPGTGTFNIPYRTGKGKNRENNR